MIQEDAEAALFSVKTFAAAMIAYYITLRIGFARPVWTVTTVYVVSQPLAGAVVSKAFFRFLGTILGSAAPVVFLPAFVNEPLVLSLVLAIWLGVCLYLAKVDRTPRSYVFLLAGYTASLVGFPSVLVPGSVFDTAILRAQEIWIAIVTASLVHGVIWPRTVTERLQTRITAIVSSTEHWSRRALTGRRDDVVERERRRLASDIHDIEDMSFQLAFDTARLLPRASTVRALQDQVSWLLPLTGAVEDRIAECAAQGSGLPTEVIELIEGVDEWLVTISGPGRDEAARELVAEVARLERSIGVQASWRWGEMLLVSLLARLAEYVRAHRVLRELYDHVMSVEARGLSPEAAALVRSTTGRWLHRDHALALRSGLGSAVAVAGVCTFWIATAWPSGATAALFVGVACALFGTVPRPGVGIRHFFFGSLAGIAGAAAFGFAIFPRVTDFVMLVAVLAPPLLLLGSLLARPALAPLALGALLSFVNTVGLASTYETDFASFVNGAVAEIGATAAAIIVIDIFHVIGADVAFARLLRACFRDIAARADGTTRDTRRWTSRMIDRLALIAGRSAGEGMPPALRPYDGLVGLRIGYLAGELHALSPTLETEEACVVGQALAGISAHFRSLDLSQPVSAGESLLHAIDRALAAFAADPRAERRRTGTILLTGLRRTMFPHAEAFVGTRQ